MDLYLLRDEESGYRDKVFGIFSDIEKATKKDKEIIRNRSSSCL